MIDSCSKPTEFKACLLTLCFYHSIVLGRKKFGQQGWSKRYSFNQGDLTVCADVLLKVGVLRVYVVVPGALVYVCSTFIDVLCVFSL